MVITCDWCDHEFTVSDLLRGTTRPCPSCGAPVEIPGVGVDMPAGLKPAHIYGVMITVTLVFVVALVLVSRWYLSSTGGEGAVSTFRVICKSCGRTWLQELLTPPLENTPVRCRHCGTRDVYQALNCRKCGEVFPRMRDGEKPGGVCPKCGSSLTGPASGAQADEPAGRQRP